MSEELDAALEAMKTAARAYYQCGEPGSNIAARLLLRLTKAAELWAATDAKEAAKRSGEHRLGLPPKEGA